ncbi:VWA domain-containing protein, partial [Bifidobacterium adolescentis]
GKYTLNLNVVGKDTRESHETTEKIEVVLVLDTSGSMNYCMDGSQRRCNKSNPKRLTALKEAATSFIDATETTNDTIQDENSKVRIAIAQFGQTSGVVSSLTSDTVALKSSVAVRQWRDPCGQRHGRRADGIAAGKARREENRHFLRGRCADHAKRF